MAPLEFKSGDAVIEVRLTPPLWRVALRAIAVAEAISMRAVIFVALSTLERSRLVKAIRVTAVALSPSMLTHERELALRVMVEHELLEALYAVAVSARRTRELAFVHVPVTRHALV